jgi:hypothetical protein
VVRKANKLYTHEEDIEDKNKVSVLEYSAAFPTT